MLLRRKIDKTVSLLPIARVVEQADLLPEVTGEVLTGLVSLHPRGFGFVTTETGQSYFMAGNLARFVLTGDKVEFVASDELAEGESRSEVKAVRRIKRESTFLLCELRRIGELWHLVPDEPCFRVLRLDETPAGLNEGDVVGVTAPAYDGTPMGKPMLVSFKVNLGIRTADGFLHKYVTWRHGFQESLPVVLKLPHPDDADRQSFTHLPFVTIDGDSTLDLDDALHVTPQGSGWLVHVAISDVSSLIQEGSDLDLAAAARGTSLYLPGQVLPMLPFEISNGVCSLIPGHDRRAVVLRLSLDSNCNVLDSEVTRAWIRSEERLTYNQVSTWLAGGEARFGAGVEQSLSAMASVFAVLQLNREQRGKLDFDEPEPVLKMREDGTWHLVWEGRTDAHKLVEEFMLLANQVVADMLVKRYGTSILRRQLPPLAEDWSELREWAAGEGVHDLPENPCMRALSALSRKPGAEFQAVASQKIRSVMRPASYAVHDKTLPSNGHFSLGIESYTHLTSPIRRYADLLVHRLLLKPSGYVLSPAEREQLTNIAARCSDRARAARMAERYCWDQLKLAELITSVAAPSPMRARIIRANAQGARVLISGWQVMGWMPASQFKFKGYTWTGARWDMDGSKPIGDGSMVDEVYWIQVIRERAAHPELQLGLSPAKA